MITGSSQWLYDEIIRRVEIDRAEKAVQIGEGYCQDYADYRYSVGFLAGMKHALEIAEDIKKEQEGG